MRHLGQGGQVERFVEVPVDVVDDALQARFVFAAAAAFVQRQGTPSAPSRRAFMASKASSRWL